MKVRPAVSLQRSREDYYGSLSDTCRDSYSSNAPMDSLKVTLGFFTTFSVPHFLL